MDNFINETITTTTTTTTVTIPTLTDKFIYNVEKVLNELDSDELTVNGTDVTSVKIHLRLYDILIPVLGVLIIILNLAVVISSGLILKKGQQTRSTYLFMGNVALSDLVTGIAVLFGLLHPKQNRNIISCSIQIGLIVSPTIISIYSVGLIAVDRFLFIVYGLQYQKWIYLNRARLLIGLTWILGLVIGFLPALGWRTNKTDNGRICWFILIAPPELVFITVIFGFIPVLIIFILYGIILNHALKKVVQLKDAGENQNGANAGNLRVFRGGSKKSGSTVVLDDHNQISDIDESIQSRNKFWKFCSRKSKSNVNNNKQATGKSPSKWKAIKVVILTTGSYLFTWVPYFIASTLYIIFDPITNLDVCYELGLAIASPLAILGFLNSLLNPIIYAWWHNGFRESVKKICSNILYKTRKLNVTKKQERKSTLTTVTSISTTASSSDGVENENKNYSSYVEPEISTVSTISQIHLSHKNVETPLSKN